MLKLMTVHNGGWHESVRSRADDLRFSSSVVDSRRRSRSIDGASRMVQRAANEPGCARAPGRTLEKLLRQRRCLQDPVQSGRGPIGPVAIPERRALETGAARYR